MYARAELLILPYSSDRGRSLLDELVAELESGRWKRFQAAIAFAKESGNDEKLIAALAAFLDAGGRVELTFGADAFSATVRGSDFVAIKQLLDALGEKPGFELHLYHEPSRTFHPKLYAFSNVDAGTAKVIVGSSNWSRGGLLNNVEANGLFELDLSDPAQNGAFADVQQLFSDFWTERL